jgi:hypothetical protein
MTLAYLDPGAGSLMVQMILAAALAVPFFIRTHIARGIDRIRGAHRTTAQAGDQERSEE